jgi:hypothetical protein
MLTIREITEAAVRVAALVCVHQVRAVWWYSHELWHGGCAFLLIMVAA